ncbi:MAG: flagellar basal body rod protein FlgC [Myxococcota bacterium]
MNLLDTLQITASGLTAQRLRLQTVASNMANARTTRTEEGGPYKRQMPVLEAISDKPFGNSREREMARVEVMGVVESDAPPVMVHDPGHPDADVDGYVAYPNVNILEEMVDLMTTSRTYEANANVIDVTDMMANTALEIGR